MTDSAEYDRWDKSRLDAKGAQYDPTVANEAPGCPASKALKEDSREKDLRVLRRFRDEVLSKIPAAREIIALYYEWSPVIVRAMEEDENIMENVKGVQGILPLVEKAVR